ncbi:sulfotransferase [Acetobacteraceae bacterium KSS8]|uniref:Sulfotransferase n=1 Tax=Endosaccharibacter trunci TaxID=2812733 RepID=A0ABT1W7M3_9PROT|nr:sulfotransferase [Acetobacteraceae bacterium KSS8]
MDLLNKGVLRLHEGDGTPDAGADRPRTVIISGVARSGTSMVARVLHASGLYLGDNLDDVVFEDSAFALMLESGTYQPKALSDLLLVRNARHSVWGFKRPHLHQHGPEMIRQFRNPHLVLTVRDPAAIAERNSLSERFEVATALSDAASDLQALVSYAVAAECPVLLVSYEKAISLPEMFVRQLFAFCGLPLPSSKKALAALVKLVEPNRPAYVQAAKREFEGYVDRIDGTILSGWARQKHLPHPVPVTVLRDGVAVAEAMADHLRTDLLASAIGDGRHGFEIDLSGMGFKPSSRVAVRIGGRNFSLVNSGSTVSELGG